MQNWCLLNKVEYEVAQGRLRSLHGRRATIPGKYLFNGSVSNERELSSRVPQRSALSSSLLNNLNERDGECLLNLWRP